VAEITLDRTGLPPLRFRGEEVARVEGRWSRGRETNRWHEVAVYRTEGGRHVVAIGYRTLWQGELDHDHVTHAAAPAAVIEALQDYAPLAHIGGYPPGESYREKQDRLQADILRRWEALVSELYERLGPDYAEVIA
jgi:hypothetical protein